MKLTPKQHALLLMLQTVQPGCGLRSNEFGNNSPSHAANALLPLRAEGVVSSENDGQTYVLWRLTASGRALLNNIAAEAAAEAQARSEAAQAEEQGLYHVISANLLVGQRTYRGKAQAAIELEARAKTHPNGKFVLVRIAGTAQFTPAVTKVETVEVQAAQLQLELL